MTESGKRAGLAACFLLMGCCVMLSGCTLLSAATGSGKEGNASMFGDIFEEREHDCRITVKDGEGEVLYESSEQEVIRHFAELVEQLEEEMVELSRPELEEVLYEFEAWDNDKMVAFQLYEPGTVLSCGVGWFQTYFLLPEDLAREFSEPEEWME